MPRKPWHRFKSITRNFRGASVSHSAAWPKLEHQLGGHLQLARRVKAAAAGGRSSSERLQARSSERRDATLQRCCRGTRRLCCGAARSRSSRASVLRVRPVHTCDDGVIQYVECIRSKLQLDRLVDGNITRNADVEVIEPRPYDAVSARPAVHVRLKEGPSWNSSRRRRCYPRLRSRREQ